MLDRDIVTNYRETVISISIIREQVAWNRRHGLPIQSMLKQQGPLINELMRFEDIMDSISDRRIRIALCCRYALGMSERDTAAVMGLERNTVRRICAEALQRLS